MSTVKYLKSSFLITLQILFRKTSNFAVSTIKYRINSCVSSLKQKVKSVLYLCYCTKPQRLLKYFHISCHRYTQKKYIFLFAFIVPSKQLILYRTLNQPLIFTSVWLLLRENKIKHLNDRQLPTRHRKQAMLSVAHVLT